MLISDLSEDVCSSDLFATDLAEADPRLFASPGMSALFSPGGAVLDEGAELLQPLLAATLGTIRTEGATALHGGPLADRFLSGIARVGGRLDRRELAAFAPHMDAPIVRRLGSTRVAFTPWFETQGPYQALLWEALAGRDRFADAREDVRPHLVAEAAGRARAAFAEAAASGEIVSDRSEEHTSELQSLMRISYAVFCLKKKKNYIDI